MEPLTQEEYNDFCKYVDSREDLSESDKEFYKVLAKRCSPDGVCITIREKKQ